MTSLAERMLLLGAMPQRAETDAVHTAVASVFGLDYLLTWNCTHIANAAARPRIERACRELDFQAPIICTPEELMEILP